MVQTSVSISSLMPKLRAVRTVTPGQSLGRDLAGRRPLEQAQADDLPVEVAAPQCAHAIVEYRDAVVDDDTRLHRRSMSPASCEVRSTVTPSRGSGSRMKLRISCWPRRRARSSARPGTGSGAGGAGTRRSRSACARPGTACARPSRAAARARSGGPVSSAPGAVLSGRDLVDAGEQVEGLPRGKMEPELGALAEDSGDVHASRVRCRQGRGRAPSRPGGRMEDARQDLDRRALARAVGSDEGQGFPDLHLQVEPAHRMDRFLTRAKQGTKLPGGARLVHAPRERLAQVRDLNCSRHRRAAPERPSRPRPKTASGHDRRRRNRCQASSGECTSATNVTNVTSDRSARRDGRRSRFSGGTRRTTSPSPDDPLTPRAPTSLRRLRVRARVSRSQPA